MKFLTILNFISKITSTILIFVIVKTEYDFYYVPLLNSLGFIISGFLAILILKKKYGINFSISPFRVVKKQFKIGFNMFLSNISITTYTTTNGFILGNIVSNEVIGYYGGVEKIIQVFKFMFTPFFNALYPYFSKIYILNPIRFYKEVKLGVILSLIGGFVTFGSIIYFAKSIIILVLGSEYLPGLNIFYIFSFLILITPLSYFIFNVIFLSLSFDRYTMRIYLIGGGINLLLLTLLITLGKEPSMSAALSNVLTQLINLIVAIYFLYKYRLLNNNI